VKEFRNRILFRRSVMNPDDRLELLMQRAADGELSAAQRRELMNAAGQLPDGWKRVACTFLEVQLVGSAIRRAPLSAAADEVEVVQPVRRSMGFWYSHPSLTTAITICLAFVLGISVPWGRSGGSNPLPAVRLETDVVGDRALPQDLGGIRGDAVLREHLRAVLHLLERPGSRVPTQR
jgi:hypothetical protein